VVKSIKWILIIIIAVAMTLVLRNDSEEHNRRKIWFSGYEWEVRPYSDTLAGPGPNYFSGSEDDVWIDRKGQLHLKITKKDGRWYCSEVMTKVSLGYGRYIFQTTGSPEKLDKNVVVGLFTWDKDSKYYHREIDIEFAKWGQDEKLNAQYTVQPWEEAGNIKRFKIDADAGDTTHVFEWNEDYIFFQSFRGHDISPPSKESIIESWRNTGTNIPPPGNEKVLIDFWLNEGNAPSDGNNAEIVVKAFKFQRMDNR